MKCRFTFSELLFVIGMSAVLLTVTLPLVSGEQQQALADHCRNNLKQSAQAMTAYSADNNGYFLIYRHDPESYRQKKSHVTWGFWMTELKYLDNGNVLVCPAGTPDGVSSKNNRFQLYTYGVLVNSTMMPFYRATEDRNLRVWVGAKTTPEQTLLLVDSLDPANGKQSYNYHFAFGTGPVAQQRHDDGIHAATVSGAVPSLMPGGFAQHLAADCRRAAKKPPQATYADASGQLQQIAIPY